MFYKNGFTIIEIFITIGIISVIVTVGLMSFGSFRQDQDLKLTTSEIVGLLRDAQSRSITQDKSSSWSLIFTNSDDPAVSGIQYPYDLMRNGTIKEARYYLPSSIKYDIPISGSSTTVQFERISGRVLNPGSIRISAVNNSQSSSTIYFDASGNIRY